MMGWTQATAERGRTQVSRRTEWAASGLGMGGAVLAAIVGAACARHAAHLLQAVGPTENLAPTAGLEVAAIGLATTTAAWLSVLLLLGGLSALPGHRCRSVRALAGRLAPALAPRVAAGLVGSVVALTSTGTAQATETVSGVTTTFTETVRGTVDARPTTLPIHSGPVPMPATPAEEEVTASSGASAPEPGWAPTQPPRGTAPRAAAIELVSRGGAVPDTVVVRAGDTLWDIAARQLGAEADAAAIAEEWPRWWHANRVAIGSEPDLLIPGTVLVPPEARQSSAGVSS